MKYVFALLVIMTMALWIPHRMDIRYAEGVAEGKRLALQTSPPSEALEVACVSMWVGEQNKKAAKEK
jgi:hypothetical protein